MLILKSWPWSLLFSFSVHKDKKKLKLNLHENISNKNIAKLHAKDLAYLKQEHACPQPYLPQLKDITKYMYQDPKIFTLVVLLT